MIVAAPDMMPGDLVKLTHAWLDHNTMSPIVGEGARMLVISTPGVFASQDEALVLVDHRLLTMPDWWLRIHCNVLNEPTPERPHPGHA